jgi:S-adenosylmethionine hydrolase
MLKTLLATLTLAVALALQPAAAAPGPQPHRTIAFMTDFGLGDDSVAICKAVIDRVAPDAQIADITHAVDPYDIAEAARFLAGAAPYYPADTVFLVVVDPGVGSARKAIIARSRSGQSFVVPDNGLITLVERQDPIVAAREITNPAWMIGAKRSSTFHGRDIFSPAAAHMARGDDWSQAGPALDVAKLVRLDLKSAVLSDGGLEGQAIGVDGPYGNLILNVPGEMFARLGYRTGDEVPVTLDGKPLRFPFARTFSDAPVGQGLFYIDSRGRLSLAINQGNFAKTYKVGDGATLLIPRKP